MKRKIIVSLCLIAVSALMVGIVACVNPPEPEKQEPVQLSVPTNFEIKDDTLFWDEVENAKSYAVEINGIEENCWNYWSLSELTQTPTLVIRVKAVGDVMTYTDSEWVEYTYEKPTEALLYKLLPDKSGYEVTRKNSNFAGLEGRLVIPDNYNGLPVKSIAKNAFSYAGLGVRDPETGEGCNWVTTSVRFPKHVESIGDSAFAYCIAITEIEIPETVTFVDSCAFNHCVKLSNITIPSNFYEIPEGLLAWTAISHIEWPNHIEKIGDNAFQYCNNLTTISIPNTVTEIGNNAFQYCANLATVSIPNSVKKIGVWAFKSCTSLTEIVIPNSVIEIGVRAFSGCSNLEKITMSANLQKMGGFVFEKTAWYENQPDGFVMLRDDILYNYKGEMAEGTVIERLPSEIKYVASDAFYNCKGLTSITLPDGLTYLGGSTFSECSSLKEIVFPSDLTEIFDKMFYQCTSLESIIIPEGIKSIGESAFFGCGSLSNIELPSTLEEIGAQSLGQCKIDSIVIPNGVKSIKLFTFIACGVLESIVLPATVTTIESAAFRSCRNLKNIYYVGTETQWNNIYVDNTDNENFLNAQVYYYSEVEPPLNSEGTDYDGAYWHYVDGEITPWIKQPAE